MQTANKEGAKAPEEKTFKCNGCGHELSDDFSLRTDGYCYLCDPNITLQELLSDEPIN